ncbi:DUF2207 domain-containing protein [Robertmurraya kyonggiensis]|uniref:DUF2207 domain-containing protein n=1 Tax=Robertmurraya kyonggiensis TaxID=1037680 RepID=A0A4U1D468_9BACI|nr:DUF2207 domain-containing protein [Robertmurraya kyonggiensis]TKC17111.1 DUF2207 domain-containing protein [Robertmurraya kyonggiensis]
MIRKIFPAIFVSLLTVLFLFPITSWAADFMITQVRIDAFLQENGNVEVQETHTYSFDGDFNGITREIIPKKGTSISKLKASENGNSLKVEKEDDLYKIYRKGEDELITVDLAYTIKNGIDKYADVAEFYWPFFDDRNESPYENMTIVVHPPSETSNVIAYGDDEAFDTEMVQNDGSVIFQLGEVPEGENGDIRVAYDAAIFPSASIAADKNMKDSILQDRQDLYEKAAARAEMRETLDSVSFVVVIVFTGILLLFGIVAYMRARARELEVERRSEQSSLIPKEELSMPATLYFIKGLLPADAIAAALLDLVRKGYVKKLEDDRFQFVSSAGALEHEQMLMKFLFDEIGSRGEFSFADLKAYTKRKSNHEKYHTKMTQWQQAVQQEVKEKNLFEKNGKLRWLFATFSIFLFGFGIYVLVYELFGWFFACFGLFVAYLILALVYRPKTTEGIQIKTGWRLMKERLGRLSTKEWEDLSTDEQMRGYIFGIGMNDKNVIARNKELIQSFQRPAHHNQDDWFVFNSLFLIGPLASSHFQSADRTTQSTVNTTSSTTGGGGGVGGGGGGSGAF